ncbi:peptidase domain-containing ABC transporter [Tunicatimonas pelagia]|uniref:peptidase domain-containing ABC transporter n=1 Tax=Tunicatimonas pelagia TaxID=931531 RepID=UPI002666F220|nr:ATP-binding cassette domain-containing protein [Tunicatimonas pelagia]WKN41927.1 ATP-binding cassette domain-containing protein [Tunicatimonas pelagia]
MDTRQITSLLHNFSDSLKHEHSLPELEDIVTNVCPVCPTSIDDFISDLSEAGERMQLVFISNSIAQDKFQDFVKDADFPILLFQREKGDESDNFEPVFVRLNEKLEHVAARVTDDGSLEPVVVSSLSSNLYLDENDEVVFVTAFPFHSTVGKKEDKENPTPVQRFIRLLAPERKDIFYVYVYAIAVGIISLSLPLGTQAIVGFIAGGMWFNSVVLLIALVIVGILVSGVLQIMQISMVEILQRRVFAKTAFEFAYRIPKINAEALFKYHTPELINRFFDILTVQKGLPKILIDLSTALLQILFGLILLSFYHPFFVFFALLLVAILVAIFYFTGAKGLDSSIIESKYKYKVAYWLEELGRALSSFKVAGTTRLPIKKADYNVNQYLLHRKVHFGVLIRQFSFIVMFKVLITAGVLVLGTILVIDRQITLGQFVASELIIVQVIGAVEKIIINLDTVYDVLTAVDKIGKVTDKPLENQMGVRLPKTYFDKGIEVDIQNLNYNYPGYDKKVLKEINLTMKPGERICITGHSGSGKSTLVNIIDGIYPSYKGVVTYNNVSLSDIDVNFLRDHIAKNVSQEDIFDGTVLENILLGKSNATYQTAIEAIEAVGATDEINQLPEGLHTPLVSGGKTLSTGLAHKITLARCIAKKPKVIILNDFFFFFEQSVKERLIRYLTDAKHSWTLITVSTDPVILTNCTRVIVLKEGAIVTQGTYDEVSKDPHFQEIIDHDIRPITS